MWGCGYGSFLFKSGEFIGNGQLGHCNGAIIAVAAAACAEKICVSAVAGGAVSPAVSGDGGKCVQSGAAASDYPAGDCVHHAAGAD